MELFKLFKLSFLLIFFGLSQISFAQDLSQVEIKTQKIKEGFYLLQGAGGNVLLQLGEDGIFLIDDDLKGLSPKLQKAIQAISKKPIKFLLNTHWHFDHTGGNEAIGKGGSVIVAHENTRKYLSQDQVVELLQKTIPASPKVALPVITFTQGLSFHFNGEEIQVEHIPGAHTDGDAIVYFKKAGILHLGDLYFNGMYPFIDIQRGGHIDGMIAGVQKVLKKYPEDTILIPGHGPLSQVQELKDYLKMLETSRQQVAQAIKKYKTLQAIQESKPTASLDSKWGNGFLKPDDFVALLYFQLKK
ncbi:MAG: MBL fold metallo-hydrolase [Deltaproteobacteria bacterium]|nr:MBL fold metallo-hydrolase [Deltaproteobacteria bacterium]